MTLFSTAPDNHTGASGSFKVLIYGLALSGLLAGLALWLTGQPALRHSGLGALTIAILLGIVLVNVCPTSWLTPATAGIGFAKHHLLRLGIVLYGFQLTFTQLAAVGFSGLIIDILTLSSTFLLACWLGKRLFHLDTHTVWLIGAGSSICGAAAILATEPVVNAAPQKVAVAVATVVIFGTLAIFVYPLLWPLLDGVLSPTQFGIFTGSTIHEVAQVVAAGQSINPAVESAAVIAKMLRVMMLAPFLMLLSLWIQRHPVAGQSAGGKITVPWFALWFIVVAALNSLPIVPEAIRSLLVRADTLLLATAMAALGLTTRLRAIRDAGVRPLLLALMLFAWLIIGGGAINLAVQTLAR